MFKLGLNREVKSLGSQLLVALILFKIMATIFYGCYYYYFNHFAPKWSQLVESKLGFDLFFLKIEPYLNFSFLISSFQSPTTYIAIPVLWYLIKNKNRITWESLNVPLNQKILFLVPGFLLCWELLTYDYNYYLNQYFIIERILMVLFLVLIWRHPLYAIPFLVIALMFRAQFNFPLGGFQLFDKKVLFDMYVLLMVVLLIAVRFSIHKHLLWALTFVLVGGNYFATAIGKFWIAKFSFSWPLENRLDYLVQHGVDKGWSYASEWVGLIEQWMVPLQIGILLIELSAIFLFILPKWRNLFLVFAILMHLGIFFFGGILFWKWILLNIAIILLLRSVQKGITIDKRSKIIATFGIVTSFFWSSAYTIGWFDTKFNQKFEYVLVTSNNEELLWDKSCFNPYHQEFNHEKFLYLLKGKYLKISGFGYTFQKKLASTINNSSYSNLKHLENTLGKDMYDEKKDLIHTEFMKTYFKNYFEYHDHYWLRSYFRSPRHIYGGDWNCELPNKSDILEIRIYLIKSFIDDELGIVKEKSLIKSIPLE